MPKYLSIDEAADFLGLKKSYLYKLVHLGKVSSYKPAGKVYFTEGDLNAFICRNRRAADFELADEADRRIIKAGAR